jgi:hypothetical protein
MPAWGWIVIVAAMLVVVAVIWAVMSRRRTAGLRQTFGPEYDRTVKETDGRRKAESELAARRERREELDIRPLTPAARSRYEDGWRQVQMAFVDDPSRALGDADEVVILVMRERGYPMDDFDQRASDLSVDHPDVVQNYRAAHGIAMANGQGRASTEDLRQAMVHYRSLFEELLGDGTGGDGQEMPVAR